MQSIISYAHPFLLKLYFCTLSINSPLSGIMNTRQFSDLPHFHNNWFLSSPPCFVAQMVTSQLGSVLPPWLLCQVAGFLKTLESFLLHGSDKVFQTCPRFCPVPRQGIGLSPRNSGSFQWRATRKATWAWELVVGRSAAPVLIVTELGEMCVFLRSWGHTSVLQICLIIWLYNTGFCRPLGISIVLTYPNTSDFHPMTVHPLP